MIIQYYGGYMDLENIRELVNTNKEGTNAYDLVEGVKRIGFSSKGIYCPLEKLEEGEIILPCIANVTLHQSYSHFIVIYHIDFKKKELLIADPSNKIMKMKFDIFQSIYSNYLIILYPNQSIIHIEKNTFQWRSILGFFKGNFPFLTQTILLSVFILFYSVMISFYGEYMLKNLQNDQKESYFLFLFILFLTLTFLKITSEFFRTRLFLWIEKKLDILISKDTFYKVLSLPYRYYYNHTTGDILSRIQALDDIKLAISKWMMVLIVDIPLMIISMICLYILQAKLALLVLLFFFIQFLILKIFHTSLEEKIEECEQEQARLATIQVETIRSFETMKGLSLEEYFEEKWLHEKVIFLSKVHRLEKWISLENYGKELCHETSSLVLLLVGCLLVKQGSLSFAKLLTIENLAVYFFNPVKEFMDLDEDTKRAKTAWNRISVFTKKVQNNGYLENIEGSEIQFQNLSYSYRAGREILHRIHLSISSGEKVLVLGPSGSGKSTLFKLLKRYYDIPRGMITIHGNDINDYKNTELISYIHQTENLYTGSMLDNLRLNQKPDDEFFQKIMKICCIEDIANKDNLGYYRLIEENGINLSGGERQRVVLARTLLQPFQILIIDEGLNQVDVNLERKILKGVFEYFHDKTIIIISHRENNLDLFERKIILSKGMILDNVKRSDYVSRMGTH